MGKLMRASNSSGARFSSSISANARRSRFAIKNRQPAALNRVWKSADERDKRGKTNQCDTPDCERRHRLRILLTHLSSRSNPLSHQISREGPTLAQTVPCQTSRLVSIKMDPSFNVGNRPIPSLAPFSLSGEKPDSLSKVYGHGDSLSNWCARFEPHEFKRTKNDTLFSFALMSKFATNRKKKESKNFRMQSQAKKKHFN